MPTPATRPPVPASAALALRQTARRARRVRQTVTRFRNWPAVLTGLGGGRRVTGTLTFRTRSGLDVSCPNVPGARVPVYEIFAEDCYRMAELAADLTGPQPVVVDIGAHVGAFACELARRAPQARLHCFEPSPVTADFLERNVMANGLAGRVEVNRAAVTGRAGAAVLVDNGGGSALNNLAAPDDDTASGVTVDTVTFDDLVARVGPPVLVKIDCEGGEYDLVLNSDPAGWAGVRRVVVEYHPSATHDWPELARWFAAAGLRTVRDEPTDAHQGTAWLARSG